MLSIKEKIIAAVIAIILIIAVAVGIIIQITKFSTASIDSMNVNNAIVQMNQYKIVVGAAINEEVPSENNVELMTQYIKNGQDYINDNSNNPATAKYVNTVSSTIASLNGYANETQIERTNVQSNIQGALSDLYHERGAIKVNFGANGIVIVIGAIGLLGEALYLYIRMRKNI